MSCLFASENCCFARRFFAAQSWIGDREHWILEETVCPCSYKNNMYSPYTSAVRYMIGLFEQPEFYDKKLKRDQSLLYVLTRNEYHQNLIRSTHKVFCFACHDLAEKNTDYKISFFVSQLKE